MARRFVRGLATGLVLGLCVAGVVSVLVLPPAGDATAASAAPLSVERTYGPPTSALPKLRSETAPARAPEPRGDE